MEQQIRFCDVDGARLAYAVVGSGPGLLLPALWISHLELAARGCDDLKPC